MNSVAAVTPVVMTLFGNSEIRKPLNNLGKIYSEQIFAYIADPKINRYTTFDYLLKGQ